MPEHALKISDSQRLRKMALIESRMRRARITRLLTGS